MGAPEKMEPLYSYKNAPRQKRVHSLMQEYWVAFLASLAIKSNYSIRSFSGVFGKCEIKANASTARDFSPSRYKDSKKSANRQKHESNLQKNLQILRKSAIFAAKIGRFSDKTVRIKR